MATEFFNRVSENLISLGKKLKVSTSLAGKASAVDEIVANINSPMLIMVMGEFSTGKSTFINALVKRDIATVGAQPTTAVITKLSYGIEDKIEVFYRDGTRKFFSASEFSKLTAERLNKEYDELHSGIDYVSRTLPIEILKNMTIVDSPGLNAIKPVHAATAATTRNFMDKADLVIWLSDVFIPAQQSEIDSLKKLNPRLSPLVILNKIDVVDEEDDDWVESLIADIGRKLRNNKIQVQKIIGISSKLALEGARQNNAAILSSSNISEFYNFVNNNIVPNRDAYKQNSLFDENERRIFMATEFFNRVSENLISLGKRLKVSTSLAGKASDVDEIVANINSPMLIMVMGEFSTGKSTFINALVKRDIATVGAQPTTAVITKLSYGIEDKIEVFYRDGTRKFLSTSEFSKLTAERLNKEYDELHAGIDYVSRTLPIEILKNMTIVDSPGLNAIKPVHAATTRNFMDKADSVIWLFDANTPTKQSEIDSLKRLNPRLSPLVILNKIDAVDEEDDDSVESLIADIGRKLRNNKIQVQKIIGVSSKLAFEGARRNNAAMLSSSNISEFYNFVNNNIVPNRDAYKQNSLFDEIAKFIGEITDELTRTNTRNEFLRDENAAAYVEACRNVKDVEDSLMTLFNLFKNHAGTNSNASEEYLLGTLYCNLAEYTNAKENYSLALNHFRKAAELGHTDAMVELSGMYGEGKGVAQNNSEMINWLKKAVECNNPLAFYGLGAMYLAGNGVPQNYGEAFKYFEKASAAGNEGATNALAILYKNGTGVTQDVNKACSLYKKAADAGNAEAMFKVADMFAKNEMQWQCSPVCIFKDADFQKILTQEFIGLRKLPFTVTLLQ